MATAVEKVIDVAANAAEDVAEESTQVAAATRALSPRNVGFLCGGLGVGLVIGSFGTHVFLSKLINKRYESIANEEIATMKSHYDRKLRALENREEKALLEDAGKEIQVRTEGGEDGSGVVNYAGMYQGGSEPDKPQLQNVFEQDADPEVEMSDAWDAAVELANRTPDVPYVVHRSEHEEGPGDPDEYEKYTLTYFEGDDVLCREDDTIIEDQDEVVGLGNLIRFGHGSGDPNIVYIRNDKLRVDLEVVHSDGKYATEVAGFKEDELQHSSMRRRSPRRSELDADG